MISPDRHRNRPLYATNVGRAAPGFHQFQHRYAGDAIRRRDRGGEPRCGADQRYDGNSKVAHVRLCHAGCCSCGLSARDPGDGIRRPRPAFAFFKGTCTRGIYDNMKAAFDAILVAFFERAAQAWSAWRHALVRNGSPASFRHSGTQCGSCRRNVTGSYYPKWQPVLVSP